MSRAKPTLPPTGPRMVRCAIYTRKSSEEGLEQNFNSLDAQRECAEAYIASQKHEGWTCLPDRFDDGGYTGGNMDRPALQRLMAEVEAGRVDVICVYKVDRLTRSLMDFAKMVEVFDRRKIAFVAVTQQINTATSMGRLMLNVLLSFAQFERELVSERTRDKIRMARQKGKWAGGRPLLGYDFADSKLTVNAKEAEQVRAIFDIYLRTKSVEQTEAEVAERGWTTKKWTTSKNTTVGGARLCKSLLYRMLTNPLYRGKVTHKGKVFDGEHEAIIDEAMWTRTQSTLQQNGRNGGSSVRNRYGALLKPILFCGRCRSNMAHTYTVKKDGSAYRYYQCQRTRSNGFKACKGTTVPAHQIEQFVVDRIRSVGGDPRLVTAVLDHVRRQDRDRLEVISAALENANRHRSFVVNEIARSSRDPSASDSTARLADLNDQLEPIEQRIRLLHDQMREEEAAAVTRETVQSRLGDFDPVWDSLSSKEKAAVLEVLIERVEFDSTAGEIAITLHADSPTATGAIQEIAA